MRYTPYEDSKRLEEQILMLSDRHVPPSEIAKHTHVSKQRVSYYLAKHGRSRPKQMHKNNVPMCIICRSKPAVPMLFNLICAGAPCVQIYNQAVACTGSIKGQLDGTMSQLTSEEKILLEILPDAKSKGIHFPSTAEVCMLHNVTKVLGSVAEHIRYHAYYSYEIAGIRRPKPPAVLWRNEQENKVYKERKRELDYSRRMENSECSQPLYSRKWKVDHYRER